MITPLDLAVSIKEIAKSVGAGTSTALETADNIRKTLGAASSSNSGYLTSTDWSSFNSKTDLALGTSSTTAYRGDLGNDHQTALSAATDSNTASTLVKRDSNGDFSARIITAALSGNASSATTAANCSGNAATVTNGVYTSGDQTIGGIKTFSSDVHGNITGTASNVTGTVAVANGGTGATDASTARTNLGLGTSATTDSSSYASSSQGAKADSALQKPIDVTYSQLMTLRGSNLLIPGQLYKITDFVTEYLSNDNEWISLSNSATVTNNTGTPFTVASIAATPEPLIVKADSTSIINSEASSPMYPQDEIRYDPDMTYIDGTNTAKGFIIYRKDTRRNIECYYDWRNVRFKRWTLTGFTPWATSTSYVKGDIRQNGITIAVCVTAHTSGTYATDRDTYGYWAEVFTTTTQKSHTTILGGTKDVAAYHFTFSNLDGTALSNEVNVQNVSIGPRPLTNDNIARYSLALNNTVFIRSTTGASTSQLFYNIDVDENNYDNTIGNGANELEIASTFRSNNISNGFVSNAIGPYFYNNITGANFYQNEIGPYCYSNTLGAQFYNNDIGPNCYSNLIANYSRNNVIGSNFYNNVAGGNFSHNIIGPNNSATVRAVNYGGLLAIGQINSANSSGLVLGPTDIGGSDTIRVYGSGSFGGGTSSRVSVDGTINSYIIMKKSGTSQGVLGTRSIVTGVGSDTGINLHSEAALYFTSGGGGTARMQINSAGKVMIGTGTVGSELFGVYGDAKVTGALTLGTTLSVANGGTGVTTISDLKTNLGFGVTDNLDLTADHDMALSDTGKLVWLNSSSAILCTIKPDSTTNFPVNSTMSFIAEGTGTMTIKADTGVTLNRVSAGSTTLTSQYKTATLVKRGANSWVVFGAINTVA